MRKELVSTSKFLSLVLRHQPEKIGLVLNEEGWAVVDELLERAVGHGVKLDRPTLDEIVSTNEKKRFRFSDDGLCIRASQGHSIEVQLNLPPVAPPAVLFHGTATRFWPSIRKSGLLKGGRRHVHLSADAETARKVGARHGKPLVLRIDSMRMHGDNHVFYVSENGVWLAEHVPPRYLAPHE